MKIIITFILLSVLQNLYSQDTIYTYYDVEWKETSKENQHFYRKSFENNGVWTVNDFFPNGQLQMSGIFKSKKEKKKNGEFHYYLENGMISSNAVFKKGKEITEIKYYYGERLNFTKTYDKGDFISYQAYNLDGSLSDEPMERMPALKNCIDIKDVEEQYQCTQQEMMLHLKNNITYPPEAKKNNIEGKVILQFIIDKEGNVVKIKVNESVSEECDNEAIRVLKLLPKFQPALQLGKPVSIQYNIPINFKFNNKS